MPAVGDLLADRYRILGTIGAGGMATVHRAHDERLDRDVAIKVLLPNLAGDPNLAERFEDEARTLAAAAHPGIVSVYDVDPGDPKAGREPFFVMELCEGGSLADRLAGEPRLGPDDLVPILVSVAEGLADLHAHGIVHRDVKPSNILLASDRAKLADFGLARSDAAGPSDLTTPGTAVGTMAYLAPEVLSGQSATPAADVYALGVAAFAGLTGRFPRPENSLAELIATGRDPATRVSEASPDLGDSFDGPIAAALAPEPADRPDALTFASSLTAALGRWRRNGPTIAAIPPAPSEPRVADADATTLATLAVPPPPPAGESAPKGEPSGRGLRLAAISALVVLAVVALGAIASGQLGTGSPPGSIRPNASQIAGPSPTNRLSSSASPSATSTVADRALAALGEVDAAIGATNGKDGLKGNERNDLERLAGDVRSALQGGDLDAAAEAANALADKIDAAVKKLDEARADRLRESAATLVKILGARP